MRTEFDPWICNNPGCTDTACRFRAALVIANSIARAALSIVGVGPKRTCTLPGETAPFRSNSNVNLRLPSLAERPADILPLAEFFAAKYADANDVVDYTIKDSDADGNIDSVELDSDNDGCPDVIEAGHVDHNGDGLLGNVPLRVNAAGVVTSTGL